MKYSLIVATILIITFTVSTLSHDNNITTEKMKPFQTPGSTLHEVKSSIVAQTYELAVSLPAKYDENTTQQYPVVYVMDGQWNFSLVENIAGRLTHDNLIPDAIIVGVTWGGDAPDYVKLRNRDYTPVVIPDFDDSGGADKFLDVLQKELIPYIEKHFRNSSERVITGSSFGGLIAGYAFAQKPELFNKYIISAGSFRTLSDSFIDEKLSKLTTNQLRDNTRVYLGCGELDQCSVDSTKFAAKLNALKLPNLEVKFQLVELLGHVSVEPVSYTNGLQMAFKRPFFAVDKKTLKHYAGNYIAENGVSINVVVEESGLKTIEGENRQTQWMAESKTKFYAGGAKVTLEFVPEEQGIYSVVVNAQGNSFKLSRTD